MIDWGLTGFRHIMGKADDRLKPRMGASTETMVGHFMIEDERTCPQWRVLNSTGDLLTLPPGGP
jgi:hypothetical protein